MQDEKDRDRQVNNQMQCQNSVIDGLENRVNQLLAGLSQVLSEIEPKEVSDTSQVEESICLLANNIRDHNRRLWEVADAVVDILARLEI